MIRGTARANNSRGFSMEAVAVLAHRFDDSLLSLVDNVQRSAGGREVVLMIDAEAASLQRFPSLGISVIPFSFSKLSQTYKTTLLGYSTAYPGLLDVPLYAALLQNNYSALWRIEYDVYFDGQWANVFDDCSIYDFVACSVEELSNDWPWKSYIEQPENTKRLVAFAPVMKISKQLAIVASAARRKDSAGWGGHFESFLPSIAAASNMKIDSLETKYCTRETCRFAPSINTTEPLKRETIYHPVKPRQ